MNQRVDRLEQGCSCKPELTGIPVQIGKLEPTDKLGLTGKLELTDIPVPIGKLEQMLQTTEKRLPGS